MFFSNLPSAQRSILRPAVQACRTLRAQIDHYEVNFKAEYGHPPRGRREREPLVSTYAQYKSWKQFIRDDASTQLQVRAASCACVMGTR